MVYMVERSRKENKIWHVRVCPNELSSERARLDVLRLSLSINCMLRTREVYAFSIVFAAGRRITCCERLHVICLSCLPGRSLIDIAMNAMPPARISPVVHSYRPLGYPHSSFISLFIGSALRVSIHMFNCVHLLDSPALSLLLPHTFPTPVSWPYTSTSFSLLNAFSHLSTHRSQAGM